VGFSESVPKPYLGRVPGYDTCPVN
jgi:hypothetical protein